MERRQWRLLRRVAGRAPQLKHCRAAAALPLMVPGPRARALAFCISPFILPLLMTNRRVEARFIFLPPILIYATAVTCGVLAAIALQIHLSRSGFDFVALWQDLFAARAIKLRSAGPWWAIGAVAFLVSGIVAAALSRLPLPWQRLRLMRWVAGAAIVLLLAHLGHGSSGLFHGDAGANATASLAVLCVAALLGLCGAYFTVRR
jgi:hypothetical protein